MGEARPGAPDLEPLVEERTGSQRWCRWAAGRGRSYREVRNQRPEASATASVEVGSQEVMREAREAEGETRRGVTHALAGDEDARPGRRWARQWASREACVTKCVRGCGRGRRSVQRTEGGEPALAGVDSGVDSQRLLPRLDIPNIQDLAV